MLRKIFAAGVISCLGATCMFADFTYEQTTKITGGMMAGMMKFAGAFSKQAREPIVSTVIVKGDRMAHISTHHASIVDLSNETITDINFDKKQYSVMTFAQMREALQRMSEKMSKAKAEKDPNAEMNFKVAVNATGQAKLVNGFNAKEMVMTLALEGTDKKTGETGALTITNDMWIAQKIAGYGEVQDFMRRMAQKLAWTPGGFGMGAMMRPEMIKGMAEAVKEMSKLDGMPVLTVMKMGGTGTGAPGDPSMAAAQQQQQAQQQQPKPDVGGQAGSAAGSAIGRKLGGGLGGLAGGALGGGGFGGFGRKKKQQQEEEAQQQQQAPPQQAANQPVDASGALMEATTELTTFSSAPADASKFEVPAGFKKVEADIEREMRQ